jgi:hypothetical protein
METFRAVFAHAKTAKIQVFWWKPRRRSDDGGGAGAPLTHARDDYTVRELDFFHRHQHQHRLLSRADRVGSRGGTREVTTMVEALSIVKRKWAFSSAFGGEIITRRDSKND